MKKYSGVFWVIGLCAFLAFMSSGLIWILDICGVSWHLLPRIKQISGLILNISAFLAGWLWVSSSIKNKNVRLVFQIIFVVFFILAICGVFGLGI